MKSHIRLRSLAVALAAIAGIVFASAQDPNAQIQLLGQTDNTIRLKVTACGKDKKAAEAEALKSAVEAYIFNGIEGVAGSPILEPQRRQDNTAYFDRVFNQDRYLVFVKAQKEVLKPAKLPNGRTEVALDVEIYHKAIKRDVANNLGGLKDEPKAVAAPAQAMPSIMVVPYKPAGNTYKGVLDSDPDTRMAIAKAQAEFAASGVTTVDFEARMNAANRASEFEYESAESAEAQLIRNSGADVYVSIDVKKTVTPNGLPRVGVSMRAYETSTGKVLASNTSSLDGRRDTPFERLCAMAIHRAAPGFLKEVTDNIGRLSASGATVTLRIGIDSSSSVSLDDELDSGKTITEFIRSWLAKNAVGGNFHQQGKTATALIFDIVSIPVTSSDGDPLDATDFAAKLKRSLRKQGVESTNTIDGNTIYITITD